MPETSPPELVVKIRVTGSEVACDACAQMVTGAPAVAEAWAGEHVSPRLVAVTLGLSTGASLGRVEVDPDA